MEAQIEEYLQYENGVDSEVVRQKLQQKVLKYDDIAAEFSRWLETRVYDEAGLEIGGYRAKDIYELAPQLDGIGVFNFLVTLRDAPDEAEKYIQSGFVVL